MVTCHPALGMAPSVLQSASLLLILLSYKALIKHEGWSWLHCAWKSMQYNHPGLEISLFCFQFLQENKHFALTEFTLCGFRFGFTIRSHCHAPSKILVKSKFPRIHWKSSFEADPKNGQIDHCNQTQNLEFWAPQTSHRTDRNSDKKDLLWFIWEGSKGVLRVYKPLGRVINEWNNETWFILSLEFSKGFGQIHFLRGLSRQKGQG